MATITVELNDTLQECVDGAIEEVKTTITDYLEDKTTFDPDIDELDLNDLDECGRIHEIVDSAVPIYTREIETAWFLHGSDLEGAYENAGVGDNPRESDGMAAIYYYIQDGINEWYYDNAENLIEEFYTEKNEEAKEELKDAFQDAVKGLSIEEIEELDLMDLNFSTYFSYVEEHAENYLEELKTAHLES